MTLIEELAVARPEGLFDALAEDTSSVTDAHRHAIERELDSIGSALGAAG